MENIRELEQTQLSLDLQIKQLQKQLIEVETNLRIQKQKRLSNSVADNYERCIEQLKSNIVLSKFQNLSMEDWRVTMYTDIKNYNYPLVVTGLTVELAKKIKYYDEVGGYLNENLFNNVYITSIAEPKNQIEQKLYPFIQQMLSNVLPIGVYLNKGIEGYYSSSLKPALSDSDYSKLNITTKSYNDYLDNDLIISNVFEISVYFIPSDI